MEQLLTVNLNTLIGLASPILTVGGVYALMKYKIDVLNTVVFGNGKPGVVQDITNMKSDIRLMAQRCLDNHKDESEEIARDAKTAAKVVADAVIEAARVVKYDNECARERA